MSIALGPLEPARLLAIARAEPRLKTHPARLALPATAWNMIRRSVSSLLPLW